MDMVKRRVGSGSVVAGSVWESRMKIDEVKGGIKVFNGEDTNDDGGAAAGGVHVYRRVRRADVGKRKTWNSDNLDKTPIQIAKEKPDEACREPLSDGIKRSPIPARKTRSELTKELTVSVDGLERSPIPARKGRSADPGNETEKTPAQLRKVKSETGRANTESATEKSPRQLRKAKSESNNKVADKSEIPVKIGKAKIESDKAPDESTEVLIESANTIQKDSDKVVDEIEKSPVGSDETPKESDACKEEIKSPPAAQVNDGSNSNAADEEQAEEEEEEEIKSPPAAQVNDSSNSNAADEEQAEEEEEQEEIKSPPAAQVNDGSNSNAADEEQAEEEEEEDEQEDDVVEEEEEEEEEIEVEIEENSLDDIKEMNVEEQQPKKVVQEEKRVLPVLPQKPTPITSNVNKHLRPTIPEQKPFSSNANASKHHPPIVPTRRAVNEEKKVHQTISKPTPISPTIKKQPPIYPRHNRIYSDHIKPTTSDGLRRTPQTHNKLQNLFDLVMWRDVSKSAFVFGIGTFTIISSSYTKDLNISLISVVSYLSLVYLAAIFLYRTFIFRGASDADDFNQDYVLGEEEAIWLIKMILPYLNEFLLKLRCLFSGDPATTLKLAVLLFIMARSGSSITIWKMAKLGFFGVFTVPKVCSCYSNQLTGYGNFWVRRFRDAWESCSHKKAVAAAIFTLVWNLSSIVARIWAVFMLFVAVRYYQQTMVVEEWVEDDAGGADHDTWQENVGGAQRQRRGPTIVEIPKVKKGS